MQITLELNPDEALALIQVLEQDRIFPDVTIPVIDTLDKARREWANDVRNMAYLRREMELRGETAYEAYERTGDERLRTVL